MSLRVIVRGWFSSRYSWRPIRDRTGSVAFVHLSALYDAPATVTVSFFVCGFPVNLGPIGGSCVQRAAVELQFLRGCDGGIRRMLWRGAGIDHLPLLARRALLVANNRIIECVMCSNGAMVDCVVCWVKLLTDWENHRSDRQNKCPEYVDEQSGRYSTFGLV